LHDALDNVSAENGKSPLRYCLSHSRGHHRPHGVSRGFGLACGGFGFGMLQQCSQQRPLLRAQNPLILHQRFGKRI